MQPIVGNLFVSGFNQLVTMISLNLKGSFVFLQFTDLNLNLFVIKDKWMI